MSYDKTKAEIARLGGPSEKERELSRGWVRGFKAGVEREEEPKGAIPELAHHMKGEAFGAGFNAGRRALHKAQAEAELYAREQTEKAAR